MEVTSQLEETAIPLETRKWDSSMIRLTSYNAEAEALLVEFVDGKEYAYEEVKPTEYEEFIKAESQGKYFLANIRNKKITRKINEHKENGRS
jgi:hypothetical protein